MSEQEVCSLGIRDCRYGCTYCQDAAKVEGHWGRRKYGSGRWEELDGDPVELENGFIYKFFPNFVPAVATPVPTDINKLQDEVSEDKVEGHWEVQLNATLWVKIDFVPNEWQFATYPNNYRFVPAVATHTDKNGLGAGDESANHFSSPIATTPSHDSTKYGTVLAERDRIKYGAKIAMVQLREVLRARSKPSKEYLNGLSDAHSIFNKVVNNQQEEIKGMKLDRRIFLGIVKEESTQPTTATSLIVELEKEFAEFLANFFNRRYIDPLVEDFIRNGGSK
jgi:hypothetical protein